MRSIPFKVLCLVGMNGDSFPRVTRTPNFNLIPQNPGRGDRSQRFDDRYLFLESIISAREKIYISYVGQSIQDNSEIPPSVVVSELLDYVEQAFISPEKNIRDIIITRHCLQPFSPSYFRNGTMLFSHSEENYNACCSMLKEKTEPESFITGKLDETEQPDNIIQIQNLLAFYRNPAKYLVRKKLGISLDEYSGILEDREPFGLDRLDSYAIDQELIDRIISNNDIEQYHKMIRSSGVLPHGNIGDTVFKSLIPGVRKFIRDIKPYIDTEKIDPYILELDINGFTLTGNIDNKRVNGLIHYRYADVKANDMLKTWLMHLILNTAEQNGNPQNSYLLCKKSFHEFTPVDNCKEILLDFIKLFIKGQNQLLHFFPETSYEYARLIFDDKPHDKAVDSAELRWSRNKHARTEIEDNYYYLCFNKIDPLDGHFCSLAKQIYIPLLSNMQKVRQ
jgi:exodeoxyribonuclease V gamma subunit